MSKILIYQMLPRLFGNRTPHEQLVCGGTIEQNGCGHLIDINAQVLGRIRKRGFTHVWYTGVIRHATKTDYSNIGLPRQHPAVVKGQAGSPYAICDYYDIDPDLSTRPTMRMKSFERLIERTHRAGLKVVIDFVPNHVARQYCSLDKPRGTTDLGSGDDTSVGFSVQNNFYYLPGQQFRPQFDLNDSEQGEYVEFPARVTGNDCFTSSPSRNDWYETVKLNYGVDYSAPEGHRKYFDPIPITWKKMRRILMFWASKGVDAFRCDMAEMVPYEFWNYVITSVKKEYPEVRFIAEIYNPSMYRCYLQSGFDWLYDKVGMYDTLRAVTVGNAHATSITQQWQSTDDIREHILYFMENHDEQRIASDFFAGSGQRGIPAVATAMLMSTNPFMIYAGQEFGERGMDAEGFSGCDGRTTIFDYWSLVSLQHGFFVRGQLSDEEKMLEQQYDVLTRLASSASAITEGRFYDLMYVNPSSDKFDNTCLYTFLRSSLTQTLLVTVNFSNQRRDVEVYIPSHAYDVLSISTSGKCHVIDMLNAQARPKMNSPHTVCFSIEGYGVSVLSLSFTTVEPRRGYNKK